MRRLIVTLVIGFAVLCAGGSSARADPGDLDADFAGDGRLVLTAGGGFVVRAVAVDGSGRIIAAGYSCAASDPQDGTCRTSGASSFRMARFLPDGRPDGAFGAGGVVTTAVGTMRSQAFDVLVQDDGRIVLAGVARDGGGRDGFALVRYASDGSLDRSFAEQGSTIVPVGSGFSGIADLAPAGDGRFVATGVGMDPGGATRFALARFTAGGTLDGSFGSGGTALAAPAPYASALAGAVTPAGEVLAAGIAGASNDPVAARTGVVRMTSAGRPDGGFATGGGLVTPVGEAASFANALVALADGRAVTAGSAADAGGRQVMAFLRLTPDGRPDATWDGDGTALVRIGDGALAADAARDEHGRLVAFGQSATGGGDWRFAVARLTPSGLLDGAFGTGGVSITSFAGTTAARATAGAIAPDGGVIAAGIACVGGSGAQCAGGSPRLALARYAGNGRPATEAEHPAGAQRGVQQAPFVALSFPAGRAPRFGVRVGLACLQTTACSVRLSVRRLGARGARAVRLASGAAQVGSGRTRTVTLRLRRAARALLRRKPSLRVVVTATDRRPAGTRRTIARTGTIVAR